MWQLFAANENALDKPAPAAVLTQNSRPPLPDDMPQQLRTLLSRCWHQQPQLRPTSAELHLELQQFAAKQTRWFEGDLAASPLLLGRRSS